MRFNDWLRGKGRQSEEPVEYYEDTHDENGNYIGAKRPGDYSKDNVFNQQLRDLSGGKNIVFYNPSTPEEVETLITYLKRGETAVADLDQLDEYSAQRILDYLSGAIFALSGNIYRIKDNIFLLSPSGVAIQAHEDKMPC